MTWPEQKEAIRRLQARGVQFTALGPCEIEVRYRDQRHNTFWGCLSWAGAVEQAIEVASEWLAKRKAA